MIEMPGNAVGAYSAGTVVPTDSSSRQDKETQRVLGQAAYSSSALGVKKVEEIEEALQQAEKVASAFDRNIRFEYRKEADLYQVLVMEVGQKGDDNVIRKIPPDEVVNFIEHVKDMFGALIDVEA
ncbi:MAG: hypothetical protein EOM02_12455 [Synergistales bacterium]|nr:hypothetical protein [Synergistales bacterium]